MKKKIFLFFMVLAAPLFITIAIVLLLLVIPQSIQNPVEGAGTGSYHHQTFWAPWGDHHHHGIDIFAKRGTPIHPACAGIVIATTSNRGRGGNTVSVLGLHGRIYYYAHMEEVRTHIGAIVTQGSTIGTVGNTGNAASTPSHCHFSILTIIPRLEHLVPSGNSAMWDDSVKPFFVNPVKALDGEQIW